MAAELIAGLGIFKTLYDSVKALKDINDATVRNSAIIDLQEKILAARESQSKLFDRIGELEKELARFRNWEVVQQRYRLEKLPPGVIVRTLKADHAGEEPIHYICENCYQSRELSPLQGDEEQNGIYHLTCNRCKTILEVGHYLPPRAQIAEGVDYDPFERYHK